MKHHTLTLLYISAWCHRSRKRAASICRGSDLPTDNGLELQLCAAHKWPPCPHRARAAWRDRGTRRLSQVPKVCSYPTPYANTRSLGVSGICFLRQHVNTNHHTCSYAPAHVGTADCPRVSLHAPAARVTTRCGRDPSFICSSDATPGLEQSPILQRLNCLNRECASPEDSAQQVWGCDEEDGCFSVQMFC